MAQRFTNAARAELAAPIADTDTTLTLTSGGALFPVANTGTGEVFKQPDWFKAVLETPDEREIVYVRTHSAGSNVFSDVMRGQEGTTPRPFPSGTVVALRVTAADFETFAVGAPGGFEQHFLLMGA